MSLAASKTALMVEVEVQLKAGKAICKMRVQIFKIVLILKKNCLDLGHCILFYYLIVTAVFHKFHEIVTSDNTSRNNIH